MKSCLEGLATKGCEAVAHSKAYWEWRQLFIPTYLYDEKREITQSDMMKYEDYKSVYESLNDPADIKRLAAKLNLDEELLTVIYTQRTVRETTKKFYKVKRDADRMVREWKNGSSILSISRKWRFPPILTGLMLFQQLGFSKKQFWKYVREPEKIEKARTRKEIVEITKADIVYSPAAAESQCKRGIWGETMLREWLNSHNICYRTERDLRGEYPKTPDCLFDEPMKVNGWEINWIESKASFGDSIEVRKNIRNQLIPYNELFGDGLVVYWFGVVEGIETPEGIIVSDASLLRHACEKTGNGEAGNRKYYAH